MVFDDMFCLDKVSKGLSGLITERSLFFDEVMFNCFVTSHFYLRCPT